MPNKLLLIYDQERSAGAEYGVLSPHPKKVQAPDFSRGEQRNICSLVGAAR